MKKHIVGMAGVVLAFAVVNAHAADLRVKGSIAPASCSFTLTNSVIDYGRIDPNSLSPTNYTKLAAKSTPYTIKCGSHVKTKVGIKAVDNRAGTKIPNMMVSQFGPNYTDRYQYGLGSTAKAQKIGGYVVHLRNSVADGRAVRVMGSNNDGGAWVPTSTEAVGNATTDLTSWHTGNFTPVQLNTLSGNLEVHAVINRTSELDLNSQVTLDGQATLELRYL